MTDHDKTPALAEVRLDLDAITARSEAATPGPWEHLTAPAEDDTSSLAEWMADTLTGGERLHVLTAAGQGEYAYIVPALTGDGPAAPANADFIAHAREDVPALVTAVRGLRAEREEAREEATWATLAADTQRERADRLQAAIDEAPHTDLCYYVQRQGDPCNCWKAGL